MVISSSNRSPSPISMKSNPNPNPNPNSRNDQEREGGGVRKSLSAYPFAKSSSVSQPRSPAEYARRSSFGRECGNTFGDNHHEKENERDPNSKPVARARSPSVGKVAKGFMAPTISAASKINPSPRKKVLGERNEAIRTSASLSEGKFHFYSMNSVEFADENESKTDMEFENKVACSMISDFNKVGNEVSISNTEFENKVAELSPGVVGKIESEHDLVVLSPLITTTKSSETLDIIPNIVVAESNVSLDIKKNISSSSPYDPKTNFLSPRPQFLHYKPNPRIESYIHNQGLRLEDDFGSDSVSETDNSEEVQSETSSSVGTSPVEDHQSLSSESSSPQREELEQVVESKIEPKRPFNGKWKTVTFFFLYLLGFLSFSMYSHGVGNAINQEKIISEIYSHSRVAADLAKANFNGLFINAKVLSSQSVGYLSQMIFKPREVQFSPLPFSNLTGWQEEEVEDYLVKGFEFRPWLGRKDDVMPEKVAEIEISGDENELKMLVENLEQSSTDLPLTDQVIVENESEEVEESSVMEDSVFVDENAIVEVTEEEVSLSDESEKQEGSSILEDSVTEDENSAIKMIEEASFLDEQEKLGGSSSILEDSVIEDDNSAIEMIEEASSLFDEPENQESEHNNHEEYDTTSAVQNQPSSFLPEVPEVHSQIMTENMPLTDTVLQSEVKSASESLVLERISQFLDASERSLPFSTAAITLVTVSLLAATAFIFSKKPKKDTTSVVVSTPSSPDFVMQKENPMGSKVGSKARENPSTWAGPVEVDMIGESCPSELSSFQKTSSYYKMREQRNSDEAQSIEKSSSKRNKRESLASSSSEYTMSASYGSFTTYSIVHSKQRDDEMVTPVRRSSRIRSKVTSP
ncbi:uncharacterized protein [Spinacia oleracea]|uniref:Uncharacterized protein n=1 Tax=Spinacia oleracea TaxID=3562 RepID=A0A9R0KBW8_SPIOL|nr:uncharacterized protein LOC110804661 [Spinacia oleracea]